MRPCKILEAGGISGVICKLCQITLAKTTASPSLLANCHAGAERHCVALMSAHCVLAGTPQGHKKPQSPRSSWFLRRLGGPTDEAQTKFCRLRETLPHHICDADQGPSEPHMLCSAFENAQRTYHELLQLCSAYHMGNI